MESDGWMLAGVQKKERRSRITLWEKSKKLHAYRENDRGSLFGRTYCTAVILFSTFIVHPHSIGEEEKDQIFA